MYRCFLTLAAVLGGLCLSGCDRLGNRQSDRFASAPATSTPAATPQVTTSAPILPAPDDDSEYEPIGREPRRWQDETGKFSTEASFVAIDLFTVFLKNTDGVVIEVPYGKLSMRDRLYIDSQTKEIRGKVISVTDGNCLAVQDEGKQVHQVRLDGIDAPVLSQPFGTQAKTALSEKVLNMDVTVRFVGKDKHARLVASIFVAGRWINLELVDEGIAWHISKYSLCKRLAAAQKAAQTKRLGLWLVSNPIPPWEHRQRAADGKRVAGERLAAQKAESEAKRLTDERLAAQGKAESEAKRDAIQIAAERERQEKDAAEANKPGFFASLFGKDEKKPDSPTKRDTSPSYSRPAARERDTHSDGDTEVKSYTRKDGTVVRGYTRHSKK
ncbi:MAG: thermonuclease family protein [Planctomycetota bacterium]|nr:thermonuclease family protein [Planctomycetota bacterium]